MCCWGGSVDGGGGPASVGTGGPRAQSVPSGRFCCEPETAGQIRSIFKNCRGKPLSKWVPPEAMQLPVMRGALWLCSQSLSGVPRFFLPPPPLPQRFLTSLEQDGSPSECLQWICSRGGEGGGGRPGRMREPRGLRGAGDGERVRAASSSPGIFPCHGTCYFPHKHSSSRFIAAGKVLF